MIGNVFSRIRKRSSRMPPQVPEGLRVYAVGDIHGRSDLLDQIHALIDDDLTSSPPREGWIIYLGDYIDRGHDSAGVIERLAGGAGGRIGRTFLKGNHEEMLERFLADPSTGSAWRHLGGMETLLSYRIDINAVMARDGFQGLAGALAEKLPIHHREFLGRLEISASVGDYFFCHAGVRPGVPLERQAAPDLLWIREEFLSSRMDFGKIVVHGHTPVDRVAHHFNRIDIDTGAYATGHLSCLVLEGDQRRVLST